MLEVKPVTNPIHMAKAPHWDEQAQALYFVNVNESEIHKYHEASGNHTFAKVSKYTEGAAGKHHHSAEPAKKGCFRS